MTKKTLSLSLSKLSFETSEARTNWMPFKGTCMFIDKPSDYTPSGGDKPVLFPRQDIEKALSSFENMGVNCRYSEWDSGQLFEGHDSQFKIGIVKTAEIIGNEVVISGGLWSYDFAELCDKVKSAKESLGWSIEPLMYLEDKGDYYESSETEFRGVALMWADKAAFASTYMFAQQRKNSEKDGLLSMDKEELQVMFAEFSAGINKAINDNIEGVKLEFSAQIAEVSKVTTEGFAKIDAEKAEEKAQLALEAEEKAKADLEAKAIKDAEDAEKAKLTLEAQQAEEAAKVQRQTMMFGGTHVAKFEGDTDAAKEIMANASLTPQEQFRKLIDLKLAAK